MKIEECKIGMSVTTNSKAINTDKNIGKIGVITAVGETYVLVKFPWNVNDTIEISMCPSQLFINEPRKDAVKPITIVIRCLNDRETKAFIKNGSEMETEVTALRHPDDEYDAKTGICVAFAALMDKTNLI